MKKNIIIFKMIFIMFIISSCNKYLNLQPENNTFDEVFWKDAGNISSAINGGYDLLRSSLRVDKCFFIFGDMAAGNFTPLSDYAPGAYYAKVRGFDFSSNYYYQNSLSDWSRFYRIINQCNLIIENLPGIPSSSFVGGEPVKFGYMAQARFLRAFVNFYMQRVWGDIILIDKSYTDFQYIPPLPRTSEETTLQFCIDDLKYAIDNLGNSGDKSYATKGAAQALLAHVYAWKHDYPNAELLANDVITTGGYGLEDIANYKNIWLGNSMEVIFELPMLYNTSGNEYSSDFFDWFLADPDIRDKSLNSCWIFDQYLLTNYFDQPEERLSIIKRDNDLLRKYDNVIYYDPIGNLRFAISNNLVLLRLADIYLLRAEAYFKNNKPQLALDDLNLIRNRAGLNNTTASGDALFLEIFRERRRELIGEGITQFDLIRMKLFNQLIEYNVFYTQDRIEKLGYYWGLNLRILLPQDDLLTQNPWWKNN